MPLRGPGPAEAGCRGSGGGCYLRGVTGRRTAICWHLVSLEGQSGHDGHALRWRLTDGLNSSGPQPGLVELQGAFS